MLRQVLIVLVAALALASVPAAQQATQTIKRTPLQTFDVPDTRYQTVIGIAEVGANVSVGRHTHPGPEAGYVLEGEVTLLVEGRPPLTLKTGDSYQVPAGAVHDARSGDSGARVIATYVVEKGKPLAAPAQ